MENPLNDINLDTGGPNFDWHEYGLSFFSQEESEEGHMLDNVENWLTLAIEQVEKELEAYNNDLTLPDGNVLRMY